MQPSLSESNKKRKQKKMLISIEKIEKLIPLICMIVMTALIFIQVVGRYVFNYSISWSEEIGRYLVIWITFGGSALAFRRGAHVAVSALINILPPKVRYNINLISQIITIIFFIILGYFGLLHTINQTVNLQLGPATRLPMAIPYSAIPMGSLLVIIFLITKIVREIKNKN